MELSIQNPQFNGIAERLVADQLLDAATMQEALAAAIEHETPIVQYLAEQELIPAEKIALSIAKDYGLPLLDLACFDKEQLPIEQMNEKLVTKHRALPLFKRGDHLFIAVSDPSRQSLINEFQFQTGLNIHFVIVEVLKLKKTIERVVSNMQAEALDEFLNASELDELDISSSDEKTENDDGKGSDDAPVVRFVHKILLDAINRGASDIHFEPYDGKFRVRFRQDGILYVAAEPPASLSSRISARLKVMSRLDISERRIPQDGRFKMNISKRNSIDFRVSTCPTVGGEKIVMRILDSSGVNLGVEALGLSEAQEQLFMQAINQPQGLILVTGPTGSGKTVTLYTALSLLNLPERNISTAEDPVEIKLPGINQVNINNKTGLTFASTLRAFLRQDPDVIMVGEMRDLETAEIGIKAAQTGHLVLSTLHTNSAPETLTRLVNMGIEPFNIASSVSLIIAQRLARRLCPYCKIHDELPREALLQQGFSEADLVDMNLHKAVGCDECAAGYKGRVGLFEVFTMTEAIGNLIMQGGNSLDIAKKAKEQDMLLIRDSGLQKVKEGVTSLEELNRVTKD